MSGLVELRAAVLVVAALAVPGVALFRHAGRGLRLTERFLLALALAPAALALPATALGLAGMPVVPRLWLAEFLWAVVALWPVTRAPAPAGEPLPARGAGFPSIAALVTAGAAAALVAAVAFAQPYVRLWSDAWFHAGAALEIARSGIPPQDPNFAGIPFYYFWFFHDLLALLGVAGGASPFVTQSLLNVWAVAVLALAGAQLAYRAFGRAAAMWTGAVMLLGLNPFGWAYFLLRAVVGETRGFDRQLELFHDTATVGMALSLDFPASHASLLNRFWTGTALTPAIALGVAVAWSAARALGSPGRAALLRTLALALALLAFHPAYGALALAAVAAGLLLVAARGGRRGAALALLAVLAAAAAAALPYIRACSVPGTSTALRLGLYERNAGSFLFAIGPWWLLAAPAFLAARRGGPAAALVAGAAVAAAGAGLFLVLPELNSDKLFYLAWVLLAPLGTAGFLLWCDRLRIPAAARVALAAVLVVPTSALYTVGTAGGPRSMAMVLHGDRPRPGGLETRAEAEVHEYIRAVLPAEAVVIERPRPVVNEPVPVLGERRVFCGSLDVYLGNHFGDASSSPALRTLLDEFAVRRGIQQTLFTTGDLSEPQRLYLEAFGAPLYLLVRRAEVDDDVWWGFGRRPEWEERIANREARLYRFVRPLD